jgi:hypothetical protein
MIPATNQMAINFANKVGYEPVGRLPKAVYHYERASSVDAVIMAFVGGEQ